MRVDSRNLPGRSRRGLLRFGGVAVFVLAASLIVAACGGGGGSTGSSDGTGSEASAGNPESCDALSIYTWEGENPEPVIKKFEKKYGVPVEVAFITSAQDALAKLAAGGTKQYDLITASSGIIEPMREAGVLKPIDTSQLEHYDSLLKFTRETYEIEGETWVAVSDWGFNPFLYNTEDFESPPTSWADLWDPKLKGQVSLWEDIATLFMGATVVGYGPDEMYDLNQEQLDKVRDKLLELKGNVRTLWSSGGDLIQLFGNGEVSASMAWTYVRNELEAAKLPIAEAKIDDMGPQAWSEGPAFSKDVSADCEAAGYAWINMLTSPEGQAALAESSGYSPSNPEAVKFMSKELIRQTGMEDPEAFLGSATIVLAPSDPEAYNQTLQEVFAGLR